MQKVVQFQTFKFPWKKDNSRNITKTLFNKIAYVCI